MTNALDDVSFLLYVPIVSQFPTYITLDYIGACNILMKLLGVEKDLANAEMGQC